MSHCCGSIRSSSGGSIPPIALQSIQAVSSAADDDGNAFIPFIAPLGLTLTGAGILLFWFECTFNMQALVIGIVEFQFLVDGGAGGTFLRICGSVNDSIHNLPFLQRLVLGPGLHTIEVNWRSVAATDMRSINSPNLGATLMMTEFPA